ncbi:MAG: hypothetical protein Tsb0021_13390 [Chlamydiales bacterium]
MNNWKIKCFAFLIAILMWMFVNHTITATKTVAGVPVKVVNLPEGKAIEGLMPNGLLNRRLTLILTGSRDAIQKIEPQDLEVKLDASTAPDEWIVQVTKNNLVSLSPDSDILREIQQVDHPEFIIELDKMISAKIPIHIRKPIGKAPSGYEFLGVWPKNLMHTVSGPKESVQQLHAKGLEITFDLSEISKEELDELQNAQNGFYQDEVSFTVPDIWKKVSIPLLNKPLQTINDPHAEELRIDFLRKEYIAFNKEVPIRVYYPLKNSEKINPKSHPLTSEWPVKMINRVSVLDVPLYAYEVSRLFIDIVRDHVEIVVIAEPDPETGLLPWSLEFIDPKLLEDQFISFLFSRYEMDQLQQEDIVKQREQHWRSQFRDFMSKIRLYVSPSQPLILHSTLTEKGVSVSLKS